MSLRGQLGALLRGHDPGRSLRQVAREMGTTHVVLSRLRHGRENPTLDQLDRIAEAFGLTLTLSATTADGTPVAPDPTVKVANLSLPSPVRKQVLERDGHACVLCGSTDRLEVDHVIPQAEGGTHDLANLRTLCTGCHRQRGPRGHGTRHCYHDLGCRCPLCRAWRAADHRGYEADRA